VQCSQEYFGEVMCRLLVGKYLHPVGSRELLTAVTLELSWVSKLMLESEANMEVGLREDEGKRAECMKQVIAAAVRGGRVHSTYGDDDSPGVLLLELLLHPPAHWGPVTPDILAHGVRELTKRVSGLGGAWCDAQFVHRAIDEFCKAGADLNTDGGALLVAAVGSQDLQVAIALLLAGVDVDVNGGAPLRAAASDVCCFDAFRMLLKHGANPGFAPGEGLCRLVRFGKESEVEELLGRWADRSTWGPGMLRSATTHNKPGMALLLARAGITLNCEPGLVDALASMAVQCGADELLHMLAAMPSASRAKVK
jgi:hypothetical protein